MDIFIGVIIVLLALILVGLILAISLLLGKKPEKTSDAFMMLQQQLNQLNQIMDSKLAESTKNG